MTDLTPEKRAELRELIGESPDLPYRDSPGTHGNPSDGPTYVALEALWDGRWEEVATGDYARWNGMALALAAAAVNALPALLDAADERDRLRIWQERVALAAGIGDEVEGRGVYLESDPDIAAEHMAGLLSAVDTHVECPVYCGDCGETLADTWCDHCHGSGCGPGTATGAYEECEWCAGAGKVHVGCASRSYADLVDERNRLAAQVERVRELDDPEREHKGHEIQTNVDRGPDGSAWSWDVKTCHCDRPWRHA